MLLLWDEGTAILPGFTFMGVGGVAPAATASTVAGG